MKSNAQKACEARMKKLDRILQPLLKRIDPFWSVKQRISRLERRFGIVQ